MSDPVTSRLVLLFPGFEPMTAAEHLGRFRHGAEKTAATFGVSLRSMAESASPDGFVAESRWIGEGPGWRTETDLVLCGWGDIVLGYAARPKGRRLGRGLVAMLDFLVTGTFFRYCRVSWRYALFFVFPLLLMAVVAGLGTVLALLPALLGWAALHFVWSLPAGAALAWLLFRRADRRFHLMVAMDDWAMAADLARGRSALLSERVEAFADLLATRLRETRVGEVIVAAHSLGAIFAVLALSTALKRVRPAAEPAILTVGSSLMKTALHPAARDQRAAVEDLLCREGLAWTDVQAITDPINFYRSDPARSLKLKPVRPPVVIRISLSRMLTPETFRRIRLNFFRLHRQFVLGNERRRPYAFHLVLLGPVPFARFSAGKSIEVPPLVPAGESLARAA